MILSIIVAYAYNAKGEQVIGKDNALPWKIKADMLWFREHTAGSAIIMGRKTFESIGRLLPNRDTIVLSSDPEYKPAGVHTFTELELALKFANMRNHEVFIIGGESLYAQCLDRAERLYITFIKDKKYEGDVFFPKWSRSEFKPIQKEDIEDEMNGVVNYTIFQRVKLTEKQVDPFAHSIHAGVYGPMF